VCVCDRDEEKLRRGPILGPCGWAARLHFGARAPDCSRSAGRPVQPASSNQQPAALSTGQRWTLVGCSFHLLPPHDRLSFRTGHRSIMFSLVSASFLPAKRQTTRTGPLQLRASNWPPTMIRRPAGKQQQQQQERAGTKGTGAAAEWPAPKFENRAPKWPCKRCSPFAARSPLAQQQQRQKHS